ncbi:MAG: TRAP transporter substrate-binding protein [Gammaproteobacteria bacterium]|nr:TRAP transporter substrate-binding protein [Gammaproteobacteria bacterium]
MKKTLLKVALGTALALSGSIVFAADITLKIQSSDPSGDQNFKIQEEWAKKVAKDSQGRLEINLLPVGSIVKHTETLDSIKMGIIDGHITATGYFSGKDPAFGLIGNMVGAWSDTAQLLDYMNNGGGNELLTELYKPYGVKFVGASTTGVEAFVSKKPLNGVDDLKGLKLRAPEGLVQKVFAAAGAAPVNLPGSEVYTALSKGVIDAADYTVFSTNQKNGLNDVAPHPVQPGFHSLPLIDVSISQKKWDSIPTDLQELLVKSVNEFAINITSKLKEADAKAVAEVMKNPDITIHDWSAEERKKFRSIAQGEWKKFSEKSPNAQKVFESVTSYLKNKDLL